MENMEKMIVTEYGRPIMMQKVKEFAQRSIFLEDERVIPCRNIPASWKTWRSRVSGIF